MSTDPDTVEIPASITAAARTAIYAALSESLDADGQYGLAVLEGPPGTLMPPDVVAMGPADRRVQAGGMVGNMGHHALAETVTVHVMVSVFREEDAPGEVFARAADLVDQIVAVVRRDPTLGGIAHLSIPTDVVYGDPMWTESGPSGRLCECDVSIAVSALN